jgi:hypothetical protein
MVKKENKCPKGGERERESFKIKKARKFKIDGF